MLRLSLVLMLLFASPVWAGKFQDGNALHENCKNEQEFLLGYCMGYVGSVADIMSDDIPIAGWKACIPRGVSLGQIRDIVIRWLANNPQLRHYSATSLVAQALEEAFPC